MSVEQINIVEYSGNHAKSIAEHLFEGVPEDVVRSQLLKNGINHDGKYSDEIMMAMHIKELLSK